MSSNKMRIKFFVQGISLMAMWPSKSRESESIIPIPKRGAPVKNVAQRLATCSPTYTRALRYLMDSASLRISSTEKLIEKSFMEIEIGRDA